MGFRGKWAPGKTSTRANGLWAIGVNEQFEQMGVWDKWACGNWDKSMFGEMGTLGQMGTLGPMSFGPSGHWGQMRTWGKRAPEKMSTRANRQLGQMGTLEKKGYLGQMGVGSMWKLGQMDNWMNGHFGTNEHWGKWAFAA